MDPERFALCTLCLILLPGHVTSGKLLMFLVDGFRWDYMSIHGPLPGLQRFINSGVKAEYLKPSFPAESMTNHFGLTTGLYPESNGMISNLMYDRERDAYLHVLLLPNMRWPFWWDGAEPVWITAEKNSKPAHMYYWVGCEVELQGLNASFCVPYGRPPWETIKESVKAGIQALKDDTAQLVGVCIHRVDTICHKYGPFSAEVIKEVKETSDFINFVLDELQNQGLVDDVDVLMFSDHGHTSTSVARLINVTDVLSSEDVKVKMHQGAFTEVWTNPGKLDKVYMALRDIHPHLTAYRKQDLPKRWHVKNHQRTPDIWLMSDLGWSVIYDAETSDMDNVGSHGYDNTETDMRAVFMASGPHFGTGLKTGPINVVDVYQLMCHVLDIAPAPNNGTWSKVQPMLLGVILNGVSHQCGILTIVVCLCIVWAATIV